MRKVIASAILGISLCLAPKVAVATAHISRRSLIPTILIVQSPFPKVGGADENRDVADPLAQAIQDDERLAPIVWSNTDPIFRSAIDGKLITVNLQSTPTLDEATAVAQKLKADYVMYVKAKIENGMFACQAFMYKSGSLVWQDPEPANPADLAKMQALMNKGKLGRMEFEKLQEAAATRQISSQVGGKIDEANALASVSRTWVQLLDQTLFKQAPRVVVPVDQGPQPGAIHDSEKFKPVIQPSPNDDALDKSVKNSIDSGDLPGAILLLRDSVDAAPFDIHRRRLLISTLKSAGFSDLAADEARRASQIMPSQGSLKLDGAEADLASGQFQDAVTQASAVIDQDPQNFEAYSLLGEAQLRLADYADSETALTQSITISPTAKAYGLRAVARACQGNADGSVADWRSSLGLIKQAGPSYAGIISVIGVSLHQNLDAIKQNLVDSTTPNPAAGLSAKVATIQKIALAEGQLLAVITPTQLFKDSQTRRVLALNLLSESAGELKEFLASGSKDTLADAQINLGEAMKQSQAADVMDANASTAH